MSGEDWKGQEKVLPQRMVGMEQAPQGSGNGPELPEFKECLDTALRHGVCILGGPVSRQWLDSMILVGFFQLGIFCNSVILFS